MGSWKSKSSVVMLLSEEGLTIVMGQDARIDFTASADVSWSDHKKACEELNKLIPASRRKQIEEFCLVLPRRFFFSKHIRLPSIDLEELRKMVTLQINQYLPYPAEQAVWDIVINPQPSSNSSDVVLLAVQSEVVMKYLRIFSAVGLIPTHITVSSNATAALLKTIDNTTHAAVLSIERNSSEFCFLLAGNFYFSRSIVYGYEDFKSDKLKDFAFQVRLTFESHRKTFPQSTITAGYYIKNRMMDYPDGFWEMMSQESGLTWEELIVDNSLRTRFSSKEIVSTDMMSGAALISQSFLKLSNFLPHEYRTRNTIKTIRRNMVGIAFLIIGVILALSLTVSAPVLKKWSYTRQMDRELKNIENPFLESRQERALWTALTNGINSKVSPLKFVEEIYQSVPEGVILIRIRINSQNEMELEGQALQSSLVNELQEKMIASYLFRDVRLDRSTRRAGPMGEVVYFTLSAKLQNIQNMKAQK